VNEGHAGLDENGDAIAVKGRAVAQERRSHPARAQGHALSRVNATYVANGCALGVCNAIP
jgi:hypothetical protein